MTQALTEDGGIIKQIIQAPTESKDNSSKDDIVNPICESKCTYDLRIIQEDLVLLEEVDSLSVLGEEDIPIALEIGLMSMRKGETAKLFVKPLYGRTDDPSKYNTINLSDLIYQITLKDFEIPKEPWKLTTFEERFTASFQRKEMGNVLFSNKKYGRASIKYKIALDYITRGGGTMTEAQSDKLRKEVELPCYLNLAACDLNTKHYASVIELTTKALEIEPSNSKGFYRRGLAHKEMGNWIEAKKDLKKALDVATTDKKTITTSYNQLKRLMSEQDKKDKQNFRNLFKDTQKFYEDLFKEIQSVVDNEPDFFANTGNVASVLHENLNKMKQNKINWTGFYWLHHDQQLVLGSFQGKIACSRLDRGKGVCGTAVSENKTQLVPDVHKCDNHVACDSISNSEIVIPIRVKGSIVGVLDIDSVVFDGFDDRDKQGLEKIVNLLEETLNWYQLQLITLRQQPHQEDEQGRNSPLSIKHIIDTTDTKTKTVRTATNPSQPTATNITIHKTTNRSNFSGWTKILLSALGLGVMFCIGYMFNNYSSSMKSFYTTWSSSTKPQLTQRSQTL